MNQIATSPAASALLRALIARSGAPRNRILLTEVKSIDWQSLTFTGERHRMRLRFPGPDSMATVERMCAGLDDAEFTIPGVIVADIAPFGESQHGLDGSVGLTIEALTISAD